MAREAGTAALNDAGISYQDVEAVVASYCYGEPTSGELMTGTFSFALICSLIYISQEKHIAYLVICPILSLLKSRELVKF